MRRFLFLSSICLISAALATPLDAAPASIEGSWGGSGIAKYQGRTDRLVCRVSFARYGENSFKVSSSCSSGGARYEQTGTVSSTGGSRYSGHIFNPQFNERGKVTMSRQGSRLSVTVTSERGTANLSLSRN